MSKLIFTNNYSKDVSITGLKSNGNASAHCNGLNMGDLASSTITITRRDGEAFDPDCNACYNSTSSGLSADNKSISVDLGTLTDAATDDKNVTIGENQPC